MESYQVSFLLLFCEYKSSAGYKEITCHLIFGVKMNLIQIAGYMAGGNISNPPSSMTYASDVSQESVRVGFLVFSLNGLDILSGDIQNAYLNAETKEKNIICRG